jgi:hypothetical protein
VSRAAELRGRAVRIRVAADGESGRAGLVLHWSAELLEEVAGMLAQDPTLEADWERLRELDLAEELVRQLQPAVHRATRDAARWGEVEELQSRLVAAVTQAHSAVLLDWNTPARSHELSLGRLRRGRQDVLEAIGQVRDCLASALSLPYPHPDVLDLAALAGQLEAKVKAVGGR